MVYFKRFFILLSICIVMHSAFASEPRKDVAFILVYMSTCPHCQRFDPLLKKYVIEHKIPILAYTLDGVSLPSFKDSITPTKREINKLFPAGSPTVPTLFVIDKKHHRIIRALTGEASYAQLTSRMIGVEEYMLAKETEHA